MRIGVYVPDFGLEVGGARTFMRDILGALAANAGAHEFHVLYNGTQPPAPDLDLPQIRLFDPASELETTLDAVASRLSIELVWFLAPETQPVSVPFFATVWDLEHRNQPYFPEVSVTGWNWEHRERHYSSTLPRAAGVIVGTEEGKRQIARYYAVPPSLIAVVPLPTPTFPNEALGDETARLRELGIGSPFLYYPAQFWPHKNHVLLLHALRLLADEGLPFDLVLTGADKGNLAHVREVTRDLALEARVHFLGFVDRRLVTTLYRHAEALVFPSFFGPDNLPPLEAFALGCPVLAAAVAGVEERLGDAAILFDPRSERELAGAVRMLHGDRSLRQQLVNRGRELSTKCNPAGYVAAVLRRFDDLAAVRRCWSSRERYVHP